MARIAYDDQTAVAYKAVREVPRDGLGEWREAIRRHLNPLPGMTVADIGAGTGQFAVAFGAWFGLSVLAVEPSAAMRAQIPRRPGIRILEGHSSALPLPDGSADGAWLSLMIHHIPDLEAAAREIRRVLRPGAPEEEFRRGEERLRRAVQDAEQTPDPEPRTNWLDLLVLR